MDDNVPDPGQIDKTWKEINHDIMKITAEQKGLQIPISEAENPNPAEPETPLAAETAPPVAEETAAEDKKQGSSFPMPAMRPQPLSKIKEEGNVIVAKALAEQLGTSPELKSQMRIDERKMAVLQDQTLAALSHFSYRYVYDKVRYWGHITEWWLTGSQGIGGLGRRHILQALANTSGIQAMEKAKQPNAIARNLWDRNWKQKAESEGKVVEE